MPRAERPGASPGPPSEGLAYLRNCYAAVLDWYKVADSKAQLIVTINGLVVTVVTGTAFAKPDELKSRLSDADPLSLLALVLAVSFVVAALVCAVGCLFSRLDDMQLRRMHSSLTGGQEPYKLTPEVAWWFGMIASLSDDDKRGKAMSDYLMTADEAFETRALASQIVVLSRNALSKHKWVNHGWLATIASLIAIVAFGVFYTLGVLSK